MILEFKLAELIPILVKRGAITSEEGFAFCVFYDLLNHDLKQRERVLLEKRDYYSHSRKPYKKRTITKMLNQPSFLNKIEYDYLNNILPYIETHSLFSILKSKSKEWKIHKA